MLITILTTSYPLLDSIEKPLILYNLRVSKYSILLPDLHSLTFAFPYYWTASSIS